MPVLRNHTVLSIARGVKAFLDLEVGVTRSGTTGPKQGMSARRGPSQAGKKKPEKPNERLAWARRRLESKDREIAGLRARLVGGGRRGEYGSVRSENIVWVFGYGGGRSGTTWLGRMFDDLSNCTLWSSPRVGTLFGEFYYKHISSKRNYERKEHILGFERSSWLGPVRSFILDSAAARYPKFARAGGENRYLVVNDIHGSIGAPLIMEAMPESRMILMMRDPRDVAASVLDASREESWSYKERKRLDKGTNNLVISDAAAQVKMHVENNLETMSNARQAYDNHKGHKTLLKYEDLRADALGAMKRAVAELGLTVDEAELARVVERYSWENVPEEEKGQGKFYRKATPGGWREDLAAEEIEIIEEAFAPLIEEFYAGDKKGRPADNMKSEGT